MSLKLKRYHLDDVMDDGNNTAILGISQDDLMSLQNGFKSSSLVKDLNITEQTLECSLLLLVFSLSY